MDYFIHPIYNILSSVWLLTLKVLFILSSAALGQTHLSRECFQYFMSHCKWLGWVRMIAGPHCKNGKHKVLISFLWVVVLLSINVEIGFVLPISIDYFITYYPSYLVIMDLDKIEKLCFNSLISLSLSPLPQFSVSVSLSLICVTRLTVHLRLSFIFQVCGTLHPCDRDVIWARYGNYLLQSLLFSFKL